MDFNTFFRDQLDSLRHEGRYRIFANWNAKPAASPARVIMWTASAPGR